MKAWAVAKVPVQGWVPDISGFKPQFSSFLFFENHFCKARLAERSPLNSRKISPTAAMILRTLLQAPHSVVIFRPANVGSKTTISLGRL